RDKRTIKRDVTMKIYLISFVLALIVLSSVFNHFNSFDQTNAKLGIAAQPSLIKVYSAEKKGFIMTEKVTKTDEEWKKELTPEQFQVTRKGGTERAFSGEYWKNHEKGIYRCVCCGNDLFTSDTKFESGTGWPSFWKPIAKENVRSETDNSHFMQRVEVV